MKVNREVLLGALRFAKLGVSLRGETLEQSNAFVFSGGKLISFNDEIMTQSESPLDITVAVTADEFLRLVEKFPDEELEVEMKGDEVVMKGARRSAGVTAFAEISLPFSAVPAPQTWSKLGENTMGMLLQAARNCGNDTTKEMTLVVHTTPNVIEACDNFRMFRAELETGIPSEASLPASSIFKLDGLGMKRISIGEGWAHFRNSSKQTISFRCSHEKYPDLTQLLNIGESERVTLPDNLGEIISRSVIMMSGEEDPHIRIKLKAGELAVETRKDSGWYKERKKIKYTGEEMEFDVHPKFLAELLERTKEVQVSKKHRLKVEADGIQFVVALVVTHDDGGEE